MAVRFVSACHSWARPAGMGKFARCSITWISSFNGSCRATISTQSVCPIKWIIPKFSYVQSRTFSHIHNLRIKSCNFKPHLFVVRHLSNDFNPKSNTTALLYICAIGVFMTGMSYAGVPLYRMFCQATGLGGQAIKGHDASNLENLKPIKERVINIRFNADTASSMQWNFRPQQTQVKVVPGETALAFYKAKNPTDKAIIGISTYNVVPFEAGQYFNKIQCFCFEEQILNPHEEVDMPVFFYIDPEFADDPKMETIDTITLSYTFFEAKEGLQLPLPGYSAPYKPTANPA